MSKERTSRKKYTGRDFLAQMKNGLVTENPTFVQLLGMCPTLATTTTVKNAVGMGLAATVVLICSNLLISLLRKFISKHVRISAYIVIISGFVTAVELLMKAYFYELYGALGLFIPLIVVNCIILARAEAFASKNPVLPSMVDGLSMGLGFTLALTLIATIRELLGSGSFCGIRILGDWFHPAIIFVLPAGAFLTLGFLIAAVQKVRNVRADRERIARLSDVSVPASFASLTPEEEEADAPSSDLDPDAEPGFVLDFAPPADPDTSRKEENSK